MVGIDVNPDMRERNTALAAELGWDHLDFVVGTIAEAGSPLRSSRLRPPSIDAPDIVLALHACDTATDEALARALAWEAPVVLAAPCCHHDIQRQLSASDPPAPYGLVTRHGILGERLADVLTDALRAALLRQRGTGWRSSSSWRAGTPRGTRWCGRCARRRRRRRRCRPSTTPWWRSGGPARPGGAASVNENRRQPTIRFTEPSRTPRRRATTSICERKPGENPQFGSQNGGRPRSGRLTSLVLMALRLTPHRGATGDPRPP